MAGRRNNTKLANLTLGGIALGFLLSYPFQAGFVGGLIASGCRAGMIGGLADWFAVTALFRRPLGIRPGKIIRTEIIPQNRERIFTALADMVQDELLSQDTLRSKLAALDFPEMLVRFLRAPEVKETAAGLVRDLAGSVDNVLLKKQLSDAVFALLREERLSSEMPIALAEIAEFSLRQGKAEPLLQAVCEAFEEYTEQPEVKTALMETIEAALCRYGEESFMRKMVVKSLPDPSVLAHIIQEKLKMVLRDGSAARQLNEYFLRAVSGLKTDPDLQERVRSVVFSLIRQKLTAADDLQNEWKMIGRKYRQDEQDIPEQELRQDGMNLSETEEAGSPAWLEQLAEKGLENWDVHLEGFAGDDSLRRKAADQIRSFIEKQISFRHESIGRMVRDGLAPLTDDKLVELLEDKAGNDLQMIRINGSLVGGLAGMLIYLLGMVFR